MLRLYMDVHVKAAITAGLRRRGIDVVTAQEDGVPAWRMWRCWSVRPRSSVCCSIRMTIFWPSGQADFFVTLCYLSL
jgi:hypothetical protein